MRKIIAGLMAVAAAAGALTACSETAEDSGEKDSSSVSVDEEKETEPVTSAAADPETSAAAESDEITAEECDAVLKKLADAKKSGDKDEIARSCLTNYCYNALKDFGVLDIFAGSLDVPEDDFEVLVVREADPSVKEASELQHSMYAHYYGSMAEAGMTYGMLTGEIEMTREQTELYAELSPLMSESNFALSEYTDTVQFARYVMVTIGGTDPDGTPYEIQVGAFRAPGEDVKIDLMTYDGDGVPAAEPADELCNAANEALEEISAEGADVSGVHLLSTNSVANAGILNGSYEELFDKMSRYLAFDDYIEFFIVAVDGKCGYAAAVTNTGAVMTYPAGSEMDAVYESDHGQSCHTSEVSGVLDYDELYTSAVGAIGG
ncbi:MAG: hypothetical protein NC093_00835 [Alistipes sp.]|nr:hypothetical protein [Alistipes sp.]